MISGLLQTKAQGGATHRRRVSFIPNSGAQNPFRKLGIFYWELSTAYSMGMFHRAVGRREALGEARSGINLRREPAIHRWTEKEESCKYSKQG